MVVNFKDFEITRFTVYDGSCVSHYYKNADGRCWVDDDKDVDGYYPTEISFDDYINAFKYACDMGLFKPDDDVDLDVLAAQELSSYCMYRLMPESIERKMTKFQLYFSCKYEYLTIADVLYCMYRLDLLFNDSIKNSILLDNLK